MPPILKVCEACNWIISPAAAVVNWFAFKHPSSSSQIHSDLRYSEAGSSLEIAPTRKFILRIVA